MKKILSALMLCLVSIVNYGQEIKVIESKFPIYQGVVSVEGSANDMYLKARTWFAEAFRSANDVIQMDDATNATIIGKGNTIVGKGLMLARFLFTIKIEGKDGRFRYTISVNDIHPTGGTNSLYNEAINHPKLYENCFAQFEQKVPEYVKQIANTTINNPSDEDW